jgi:CRP-like cAMP-binding protein
MDLTLEAFKKNYLVVGLSDDDVKKVMTLASVCVFQPGQEIVTLGARDLDIFIVLSGQATVLRKGGALLGTAAPGAVIGEVALLDNQARSATVMARTGVVTCARIDGNDLRRFIGQNKEIGFVMVTNIARILAKRLREASESIEDLRGQVADMWIYKDQK